MYQSQTTHPIYELNVDVSNASRLYEYYMLKDYVTEGSKVLEMGCNNGIGMDILESFGAKVYGIDVIPELELLLQNKYSENSNVQFEIVNEGSFGFEGEKFDLIVANNFIEHVPNPGFYLEEFKKKLSINGKLILTTVNRDLRLFPWQKPYNQHHFVEYNKKSLSKLVKKAFDKFEIFGICKKPPFFPDYSKIAFAKKFNLGIRLPLLQSAMGIKNILLPWRDKKKKTENFDNKNEIISPIEPSVENFDISKFKGAFECISVKKNNEKDWAELFVICSK